MNKAAVALTFIRNARRYPGAFALYESVNARIPEETKREIAQIVGQTMLNDDCDRMVALLDPFIKQPTGAQA